MKSRAILCALWEKHLGALEAFLPGSGIETVIVPAHHAVASLTTITERHGCRLVVLESLLEPGNRAAAKSAVTVRALHDYLDQDTWPAPTALAARDAVAATLRHRIATDVPVAVSLLEALAAAREAFDITLYATSEDILAPAKVTAAWARAWGIPSLHLAHAIALVDPYTVHADLVADTLAVYGRRGAEGYLDLGIDPTRIVATGNPAWDGYAALREQRDAVRADLVDRYGLDPDLPIVVFGTTWGAHLSALEGGDNHRRTLAAFLDAAEEAAALGVRFQAVVKDRPSNAAHGEALVNELLAGRRPAQTHVYATDDTQAWAVAADVLVAVESNYLVEAMLGGAIAVNLAGSTAAMPPSFASGTGVLDVDGDELAARLVELLTDESLRARLRDETADAIDDLQHGGGDGRAAQRVADLMASMMLPMRAEASTSAPPPPSRTEDDRGVLARLRSLSRRRR